MQTVSSSASTSTEQRFGRHAGSRANAAFWRSIGFSLFAVEVIVREAQVAVYIRNRKTTRVEAGMTWQRDQGSLSLILFEHEHSQNPVRSSSPLQSSPHCHGWVPPYICLYKILTSYET
jgi:hypothetical protein